MRSTRLPRAALPLLLSLAGCVWAALPAAGQAAPAPGATTAAESRVRPGEVLSGTLEAADRASSDGTHYDDWTYEGARGERLTIALRSAAFDAYLRFGRTRGGEFVQIAENDDGGEGSDSLLRMTLPADGEYVIRVNTLVPETGAYTLEVKSTRR